MSQLLRYTHTMYHVVKGSFPPEPTYLPEEYPDLSDKVVAITGTTSGIGYDTLKILVERHAKVLVFNRDLNRAKEAIKKIGDELKMDIGDKIVPITIDLADLKTIKSVEAELPKYVTKIDYIIMNAGVMMPPAGSETAQGYELQMGTNVLGHHLLLKFLEPYFLKAASGDFHPRIVWLSSCAHYAAPHGGIDYKTVKMSSEAPKLSAYGQSKACALYQSAIFAQNHKAEGIISLAVHPGCLGTNIGKTAPKLFQKFQSTVMQPGVYGAYMELYALLSPEITLEDSGSYVCPFGTIEKPRADIAHGFTDGTAKKFWDWCDKEVQPFL